jgi:hypothetical protein
MFLCIVSALNETTITNRKFQTGKRARQLSQEVSSMKTEISGDSEVLARARQAETMMDELKSQRGPSLMDQHMQHRLQHRADQGAVKRRAFDRDLVSSGGVH